MKAAWPQRLHASTASIPSERPGQTGPQEQGWGKRLWAPAAGILLVGWVRTLVQEAAHLGPSHGYPRSPV